MKNIIYLFLAVLVLEGCTVMRTEMVTYKDLDPRNAPIEMLMQDSSLITLDTFSVYNANTLYGKGISQKNNYKSKFDGKIDLNKVNYITFNYHNGWSDFAMYTVSAALLTAILFQGSDHGMSANVILETGSSCPFIYSYSNNKWNLEGEVFGTGLGKGLESSSTVLLRQLSCEKVSNIKISNERPETHYFNQVEINAIEHSDNSTAYRTIKGNYIEVNKFISPSSSVYNHKNILNALLRQDKQYWQSDLSNDNHEDIITAEFLNEDKNDSMTIVLESINTYFSTSGYYKLSEYIGNNKLQFIQSLDNDRELISSLKNFRDMSSLKIDVWNGKEWEYQGIISPEANRASFTSAATIKAFTDNRNKTTIRLRTLSDVWKIDKLSASFDYKPVSKVIKLDPVYSQVEKEKIIGDDEKYFTLSPGGSFQLQFNQLPVPVGKKITYAITAKGYLHEWLPKSKEDPAASLVPDDMRIPLIKKILSNPEDLLTILYKDWKKRCQ